jgi:tripartite-type tricarboxylate transporter receptor subunit TctC
MSPDSKGPVLRIKILTVVAIAIAVPVALAGCSSSKSASSAPTYPTRTITLIAPGTAGSTSDLFARQVAKQVQADFKERVIVRNASTETVGISDLRAAKPDGYTMAVSNVGTISITPLTQAAGYQPGNKDVDVVAQVSQSPAALMVAADSPLKNLSDFVKAMKDGSKPVTIAAPPGKTISNLDVGQLAIQTKANDYKFVQFQAGQQVLAVLNGSTDAAMALAPAAAQYVKANKIRVLSVFADEEVPNFPAKTAKEQGYNVDLSSSTLVLAPKGTPKDIEAKWDAEAKKIAASKEFKSFTSTQYSVPAYLDQADANTSVTKTVAEFTAVAKTLGWVQQ